MKIKELFKSTGIIQSPGALSFILNRENCQIVSKIINEDSILLILKQEQSKEEARAYLRPQNQFENIATELINQIFINDNIIGLTLDQLDNFETTLYIQNLGGKMFVKKNRNLIIN